MFYRDFRCKNYPNIKTFHEIRVRKWGTCIKEERRFPSSSPAVLCPQSIKRYVCYGLYLQIMASY